MSKQTYSNQIITQYLLGSLPEAEAERLDELSFTDDEFAEALESAEKDLVDAYAHGELTGAALERFKSYYLASPRRREKAQFAHALRVFAEHGAQRVHATKADAVTLDESATKRKSSGFLSALSVLFVPRPALQWGISVIALVLLITGGWLAIENMRLRQQISHTQTTHDASGRRERELQRELQKELAEQRSSAAKTEQELAQAREERERLTQELKEQEAREQQLAIKRRRDHEQRQLSSGGASIASFILTPQMRGLGQISVVSIPANIDYVAMRLQLEPNDYPAYRVALLDHINNQTLWRSNKLRAQVTGESIALRVSFRANLLKPQVYMLRVSGVSTNGASEIAGDYPFRVVKQ